MVEASLWAQTAEAGEQSTIRWCERGALHLPPEHRHFRARDHDLDSQVVVIAAQKSDVLEDPEEREVAERERHRPSSPAGFPRRKARW